MAVATDRVADEAGPESRGRRWARRLRAPRRRPYLLGELVIVLILLRVYDWIKDLADGKQTVALHHALDLVRVERDLHVCWEESINRFVSDHHWLSLLASYYYQFEFYTVAFIVLGVCYWRWPERYRPARNVLVLTNVVGLAVFFLCPVMPPRLLGGTFHFVDSVANAGFGGSHDAPVPANQYAAMPSLHVAWALWVAIVLAAAARQRWLKIAVFGYPVITTLAVMATANHYLLDAVAGAATTLACWAVVLAAGQWTQQRAQQRARPPAILEEPTV